ncbi:MAG TPA: DUF554 domain-containing protein [Streptosporangiaceae bacterium]|nr:DUF554 domain-containing protein [Streptosporangiaceae bacterium]
MRGVGTLLNVATVLAGASIGVLVGDRLPRRTRDVVTDGVGLVVLMVAVLDGASVLDPALRRAVGTSAPVLIVLGSILLGGIAGSLLRIEDRLNGVGALLQRRLTRAGRTQVRDVLQDGGVAEGVVEGVIAQDADRPAAAMSERERFIQGFVTASLVYCVGPLTILGSLQDGLGDGFSQLALKSVLDGFTSIAFAATLGWGVAAAAISVLVVQGSLTAVAAALGGLIPAAGVAALTATGGLLLAGIALRLLRVRSLPVADLLPALIVAPALTQVVASLR